MSIILNLPLRDVIGVYWERGRSLLLFKSRVPFQKSRLLEEQRADPPPPLLAIYNQLSLPYSSTKPLPAQQWRQLGTMMKPIVRETYTQSEIPAMVPCSKLPPHRDLHLVCGSREMQMDSKTASLLSIKSSGCLKYDFCWHTLWFSHVLRWIWDLLLV